MQGGCQGFDSPRLHNSEIFGARLALTRCPVYARCTGRPADASDPVNGSPGTAGEAQTELAALPTGAGPASRAGCPAAARRTVCAGLAEKTSRPADAADTSHAAVAPVATGSAVAAVAAVAPCGCAGGAWSIAVAAVAAVTTHTTSTAAAPGSAVAAQTAGTTGPEQVRSGAAGATRSASTTAPAEPAVSA